MVSSCEPRAHRAQAGEPGGHHVARLRPQERRDRSAHHDVTGAEPEPALGQVVREPCQGVQRVAQDLGGRVGRHDPAAHLVDDALEREIEPHHGRQGLAQDDGVPRHAIRDEIAAGRVAVPPEVRQLERRQRTFYRQQRGRRRHPWSHEVALHHEGDLRLHDQLREARHRHRLAGRIHAVPEEKAGDGVVDSQAFLGDPAREPGLPADDPLAAGDERRAQLVLKAIAGVELEGR